MQERLKELRKALKLTQNKFAEQIGTTSNALTNYETGRRNPSASVINNICKTFNVNEEWLRDGKGEMFIRQTTNEKIFAFIGKELSRETNDPFVNVVKEMLVTLTELNDEQRKYFVEMQLLFAKALVKNLEEENNNEEE